MSSIKILLSLITLAFFIVSCSETKSTNTNGSANTVVKATNANVQPTATVDDLAAARMTFLETCAGCHRENGEGGAAEFDGKKIRVPGYQSKGAMNASDDKLYDYIANGEEGEMPAFKDKLTEPQMRNLVKFIRKEFQKK